MFYLLRTCIRSGQYDRKLDKKNGDIWFTKLNYFYKILDNIKLKVEEESEKEAEENEDITIPDVIINKIFNANIQKIHRYLSELKPSYLG
jgi:glutaredoxin